MIKHGGVVLGTLPDPGGVGVGLALPSSGRAEKRGRQAVPLRRGRYRQIGDYTIEENS
jgi:hypothetical protein